MAHLDVDVEGNDDHAVVAVSGEVDYVTSETLRTALDAASETHRHLVLDLREMGFMDSAGLGELVRVWKRMSADDGRVVVVATDPILLRLLAITGVDRVIPVFETVESALAEA